jgi:hypothetical protein
MNEVDLGEYMSFCKDFQVPLPKSKLTEIFKKSSVAHKPHKFEQFYDSMTRIGREMNRIKLDEVNQRLKEVNRILK